MIPIWPPSLPVNPLAEGYSEQMPDNTIRTSMDSGAAKVRRRGAARPWVMACPLLLTGAQRATLIDFITDSLRGGALRFSWAHPVTGAAIECRIKPSGESMCAFTPAGAAHWTTTLTLEVLP